MCPDTAEEPCRLLRAAEATATQAKMAAEVEAPEAAAAEAAEMAETQATTRAQKSDVGVCMCVRRLCKVLYLMRMTA